MKKRIIEKSSRSDGTIYYTLNNQFHREDGPAIIYPYGAKVWFKNGRRHRLDGPAVENNADGENEYWINGERILSEIEYNYAVYLYLNDLENYK